jgi:Putative inner membrane protein (DUF1819)
MGNPKPVESKDRPRELARRYSSKIIKAGALLADTRTLLAHWDTMATVQANLIRIREDNDFAKASRSRVEDILAIFRQRYLVEPDVTQALVALVKERLDSASLDRILFYHAAKADPLIHDAVTEWLLPLHARGIIDIDVLEARKVLAAWCAEGKTTGQWSEPTIERIAQGLLSTLRGFGVLQGVVHKRIAPTHLPVSAFAYVMFYLKQHQASGAKLVEHPDWRLFFLPREGVERFLFEAHQRGLLEYHAAGSVNRLSFPARTLEEYAHVLAERAH